MLSSLLRRETNCSTAADRHRFLCYAEDHAAKYCRSTRKCKLSESPRSTFLICFSPDMTRMASSHGDHSIRVVDCHSGLNTHTLRGHPRTPWCVTFHPSFNALLASGCLGGEVRIWDLNNNGSQTYTPADKAVIASLAFHPMDHILLIATTNKLLFWKWNQPTPIMCVETASPEEKVRYVKFSPLGDHILTGVTNIMPRTPTVTSAASTARDSSSMHQFLRMVNCARVGSDQVAAYILQPATSASASSATSSSSSASEHSSQPNSRADTSSSVLGGDRADPAVHESVPTDNNNSSSTSTETVDETGPGTSRDAASGNWRSPTDNNNSSSTSTETVDETGPGTSRDAASGNWRSSTNGDYRGVFAIFRARDSGGSWNLDDTDIEPNDVQPGNMFLDRGESRDAVHFSSEPDSSGVSMSVNTDNSSLFTGDSSGLESVSFRSNTDWSAENSNPDQPPSSTTASASESVDGVVGVGRVINVGSSRSSHQPQHGSSHSSSFSTIGNQQGNGTAVATATARTFRHVHTAVVVTDGTNGGPQLALSTAINRAIAGAFAGSGEGAVASNIINTTHRLQWWDCSDIEPPDLRNGDVNVIVQACKIHNDASCDISRDGTMLAAFVPSLRGFPNDGVLALHSLKKETLGQCLFRKKFGPNAISVSLSPLNRYVMVGLAARRLHWHLTSQQLVAQIFRLVSDETDDSPKELDKPVYSVTHDCEPERRSHVSVNAAFWHPIVGGGIVYGTNKGHLRMCEIARTPDELFGAGGL